MLITLLSVLASNTLSVWSYDPGIKIITLGQINYSVIQQLIINLWTGFDFLKLLFYSEVTSITLDIYANEPKG